MALTKNPVLRDDTFRSQAGPFVGDRKLGTPFDPSERPAAMTIRGVISKGAILLLLMAATFIYSWDSVSNGTGSAGMWIMLGGVGGFIASIVISFKPKLAPFLAPIFALLEGLLLGGISA
ncbi:MAG: Bax inhibitor-1/YccA family protein, partial [Gaiellales bacterium]